MLDQRNRRIPDDALDEALASPGDHDVNVLPRPQQFPDRLAVRRLDHLNDIPGQSCPVQARVDATGDGMVGVQRFGTPSQDRGIAGLEAQGGGIRRDVGTGLVDDQDHADGHTHLSDPDSAGA